MAAGTPLAAIFGLPRQHLALANSTHRTWDGEV